MTYTPIPEERRRELAAFIPALAEALRKLGPSSDAAERQFWTQHVLDIRKVSLRGPTAAERLWLIRHAYLAAVGTDPIWVGGFPWPGFCGRTGSTAASECWPLEPIPGTKVPPSALDVDVSKVEPTAAPPAKPDERPVVIEGRVVKPGDTIYVKASVLGPGDDPKRTVRRVVIDESGRQRVWFTNDFWRTPTELTFVAPVLHQAPSIDHQALGAAYAVQAFDFSKGITDSIVRRTSLQVLHDYMNRRMAELTMLAATPPITVRQFQAAPTPSNLENTMNQTAQQATPANAHALTVDTSSIVEVKTFVFGHDIATLDDDTLLNYAERLTASIEHLEQLNAKTPLAKLVTKIAQLKDAKAKIVELLGGAPVEQTSPAVDADETKPKRVRRTKAEIEADNAAQASADTKADSARPARPAPPASKVDPDPSADMDIDYDE